MANSYGLTFSKTFGLKLDGAEEWFDPCVWLDSPLCVDPFLMLDLEADDEFKGAHNEIVGFFQRQINRVAVAGTNMNSPAIKTVTQALLMPEASELYLGYSEGVKGAGSGPGLAKLMVGAMMSAVAYGLTDIKHFEEISILGDGIGPDRISDAAAGITKWRFAQYTERVCTQLNVPVQKRILDRAKYDLAQDRWVAVEVKLPINPRTKRPILLTPQRFLRHLPTLGSNEFAEYAERKWKYDHRESLDKKLVTFDKEKVFAAARKDPAIRNEFVALAAQLGGKPYDFGTDKWGVKLTDSAESIVAEHPFQYKQPTNDKEMKAFVVALAKYFKHFIEQQKGWELLWDRYYSKPEKAVQRLMFGIVFQICAVNNVSVDPEVNAGRGPVDFKFSSGFNAKCLLETKLARNTKWIVSVTRQLPTYIVADIGKYGVYLLVSYDNFMHENIVKLKEAAASVASRGIEIDVMVVDASRDKQSASLL
jgi:hypothetical protein